MKKLVIIPTYNEKDNISPLLHEILKVNPEVHILVVDDNSPDGTAGIVQKLMQSDSRIQILVREKKNGLGKAYLAGFQWAIDRGYEAVVEMDADFSHRPLDLKKILEQIETHDFVIGSRYVPGGETVNWGLLRKFISRGGGIYSRFILGFPLNDWTGGFNAWTRETLEKINIQTVQSEGYSFQIELKYKALKNNCRGVEVPIVFEDRRVGQSKMSLKIVIEAFYRVWQIRFYF